MRMCLGLLDFPDPGDKNGTRIMLEYLRRLNADFESDFMKVVSCCASYGSRSADAIEFYGPQAIDRSLHNL
jgi:hypothetical protein